MLSLLRAEFSPAGQRRCADCVCTRTYSQKAYNLVIDSFPQLSNAQNDRDELAGRFDAIHAGDIVPAQHQLESDDHNDKRDWDDKSRDPEKVV